mgnify:CR=1 FL=1
MMAIKDLALAAKTTVDGFMSGLNSSRLQGEGVAFSQYRNYLPGDDLRALDWKAFARTGRYYIRQSEPEKTITVQVVVDASASMNHDCDGYPKIAYAKQLAAALALLAYRQGDRVGLTTFSGAGVQRIAPTQDGQQLHRIYHTLGQVQAEGRFAGLDDHKSLFRNQGKQLMVILTDFHEHAGELTKLLALLRAQGQEIIVLHLMAGNELTGRLGNYDALQDLETGEIVVLGRSRAKPQLLDQYLETSRKTLLRHNVYYELVNANETPAQALRAFLVRRNKPSG